jgi:hypothetical protein
MSFKTAFFAYIKGEKSQAELESYRRAATQVDELEAAIQTQVLDKPAGPGKAPWERPQHQQQGMAFAWVARGLTTIATTLLESDAKEDPSTVGYLPLVTFGQVKALYQQAPDFIHRAWEALANPRYRSDRPLPLPLGPRIEAEGKCPDIHLKGMRAAAQALDEYGQARLNAYMAAIRANGGQGSAEVESILGDLAQIRARAQSKLTFASDQLDAIMRGAKVPMETHEEAETRLWEALCDHFLLGQFLASPELLKSAAVAGHNAVGRQIPRDDRWMLTEPDAVRDLKGTKFGEQEIREFWTRKAWRTTPREERYLAQCEAYMKDGSISVVSRWSTCPFDPVYQTLRPVSILDVPMDKGTEFHLEMNENEDDLQVGSPRFRRTAGYEEEHEEGHVSDPSRAHH